MKRFLAWFGLVVVVLVATVLATGKSNGDKQPQGTLALRRFLAGMGLQVGNADSPPPGQATFVLFTDLRTPAQDQGLLAWVRQGGTLVVTDPASLALPEAGINPSGHVGHYRFGPARLAPGCVAAESLGVRSLAVDPADSVLTAADPGAIGCFPVSGGYFEISDPIGRGRLVALGGNSVFTNALLSTGDNAAYALRLLQGGGTPGAGAGGRVVFGPAEPPGPVATAGLWASLPLPAKVVLIQIAVALVVFALVRARRFGRPSPEHLPSPVPAGELVDAVGRLYRASQARGFAADTLRRATLQRLRSRLGMGVTTGPAVAPAILAGIGPGEVEALSSSAAQLGGGDPEAIRHLLAGAAPLDDAALIVLARQLEELRHRVEGSSV